MSLMDWVRRDPRPDPDKTDEQIAGSDERREICDAILANVHERALAERSHREAWDKPSASSVEGWVY